MMFKQLNPEAQEFFPHTFPSEVHQKPLLPGPPSPWFFPAPSPWFFPAPSPWYSHKFGVRWVPTVAGLVSRYNAHRQPLPHGVKSHFPITHFADEAATADKFGSRAKKLTARGRGESYGGKSLIRAKVRGAVWVPKKRKSDVEVVGDCIRSPPCPTLEDGVPLTGKTTVMIRNIPNQFRRQMLMEFLDDLCMDQNQKSNQLGSNPPRFEYDFLYLPMDFRRNNNYGYAFVNFTSAMAANMVGEILRDYKWGAFKDVNGGTVHSWKVCEITWARSQGKAEMVERFRNSHFMCRDSEYLPVVFKPPRDGANPVASSSSVTVVGRVIFFEHGDNHEENPPLHTSSAISLSSAQLPPPRSGDQLLRPPLETILLDGKVHGSLARAGNVRGQTPKVTKQDNKKKPSGRAHKRMQYDRRFVTASNHNLLIF
ncbi:hypothetical protein RHGRI_017105 [Rhododendron griersonianum]|uniref:Mei2-like C-terminal RNA recognition motif domain-containing protein n=1 Tax=Rhododendron griersonianum TaxID=479676 RepID=A0AAV6JWN7_9ERIC|nr:hypothetical protein RHGRI_017105 [Rhododendron griersonianum]